MHSKNLTRRSMLLNTGASVAALTAGSGLRAYAAQTAPAEPAPMAPTHSQGYPQGGGYPPQGYPPQGYPQGGGYGGGYGPPQGQGGGYPPGGGYQPR